MLPPSNMLPPSKALPPSNMLDAFGTWGAFEAFAWARPGSDHATAMRAHSKGRSRVFFIFTSFRSLEPDVLECFRRPAVELGRSPILATLAGEVATGHPGCRLMADGLELLGTRIGRKEEFLRLVQSPLFHQRPTQHELRRCDVIEEVLTILHQGERVTCLLLCRGGLARHQVHVGE